MAGEIREGERSLKQSSADTIARILEFAGVGGRTANDYGHRLTGLLGSTLLGAPMLIGDGMSEMRRGVRFGDAGALGMGALETLGGAAGIAVVPSILRRRYMPAYGTHEAVPAPGSGHLDGILARPEAKAAFEADPRSWWARSDGRDMVHEAAGLRSIDSPRIQGLWEGELSAGRSAVADVPAVLQNSRNLFPTIAPSPQAARQLDAAESLRGYLDAQAASAWNAKSVAPYEGANALVLRANRGMTPEEMMAIDRYAGAQGRVAVDTGEGVVLRDFSRSSPDTLRDVIDRERLKTGIGRLIDRPSIAPTYHTGHLIDRGGLDPAQAGSGAVTRQMLDDVGRAGPAVRDGLGGSPEIRRAALDRFARDREFSQAYNLPLRQDIQNARHLFGRGGFEALEKGLRAGVPLPAAVGAFALSREDP